MADGTKRVFSVNGPAHPIFTEIIKKRADIRFDLLKNDSPDDVATPILAGAHAYQSGSARDELAKKYHAGPDLLRRTQSLLIVSTNGAGYDTVNLKACTEAGILCLNQAGGNKEAASAGTDMFYSAAARSAARSGNAAASASRAGCSTPRSVISAVTSRAGVTSNP